MFNKRLLLFLVAAFSMTQIRIVGYIGISEFAMCLCGPFVLSKYWKSMERDGFKPFLCLVGLWLISALTTDWYRHTPIQDALRGVASPLSVLLMTPCIYWLLKDDVRLLKWAIVGFTVTLFLSTYVIQAGTSVSTAENLGITAREAAERYKLNHMALVLGLVGLVPSLFYLKIPAVSALTTLGMAFFSLFEGGRSKFMCLLASVGMMVLVGGKASRIKKSSRLFPVMVVVLAALTFGAKELYVRFVTQGKLGEAELKKYETQSESKLGILSGRSQFVAVFFAVRDSPLLGHGSWARDYRGYGLRAAKWANDDAALRSYDRRIRVGMIPSHSHLMTAYVWHGLLGSIFWCYVLYVIYQTFRFHLGVVPEVYGYLALTLPSLVWAILFSPFGARIYTITLIVVCLLLKKIYAAKQHMILNQRVHPFGLH